MKLLDKNTFGKNKADIVIVDMLNKLDDKRIRDWVCRAIKKNGEITRQLEITNFKSKHFLLAVYNLLYRDAINNLENAPDYIEGKIKSYTLNIVRRQLSICGKKLKVNGKE